MRQQGRTAPVLFKKQATSCKRPQAWRTPTARLMSEPSRCSVGCAVVSSPLTPSVYLTGPSVRRLSASMRMVPATLSVTATSSPRLAPGSTFTLALSVKPARVRRALRPPRGRLGVYSALRCMRAASGSARACRRRFTAEPGHAGAAHARLIRALHSAMGKGKEPVHAAGAGDDCCQRRPAAWAPHGLGARPAPGR